MIDPSALPSLGLELPSPAYIFDAILFGLLGLAAFRYARLPGLLASATSVGKFYISATGGYGYTRARAAAIRRTTKLCRSTCTLCLRGQTDAAARNHSLAGSHTHGDCVVLVQMQRQSLAGPLPIRIAVSVW